MEVETKKRDSDSGGKDQKEGGDGGGTEVRNRKRNGRIGK